MGAGNGSAAAAAGLKVAPRSAAFGHAPCHGCSRQRAPIVIGGDVVVRDDDDHDVVDAVHSIAAADGTAPLRESSLRSPGVAWCLVAAQEMLSPQNKQFEQEAPGS